MRKRWVIGAVTFLVVAVGAGVAIKAGKGAADVSASSAMAANTPPRDKPDETVALDFTAAEATRPVRLALPQMVEFSGALVAPDTAMVRAKATGTLLALDVQEGQRVKAGPAARPHRRERPEPATWPRAQRPTWHAVPHDPGCRRSAPTTPTWAWPTRKFISPLSARQLEESQLDSAKAQVDAAPRRRWIRRSIATARRLAGGAHQRHRLQALGGEPARGERRAAGGHHRRPASAGAGGHGRHPGRSRGCRPACR